MSPHRVSESLLVGIEERLREATSMLENMVTKARERNPHHSAHRPRAQISCSLVDTPLRKFDQ